MMTYMQEEIDELREENKNLLAANLDGINNFNALKEDYENLQSENECFKNKYT